MAALVTAGVANQSDHTLTKVSTAGRPPSTTTTATLRAVVPANRIAFTRAHPSFGPGLMTAEIVLANSDGTGEVQLTHTADDNMVASQPAWSRDRRRLAFIESTPAGAVNAGTGDIVVVNADGTDPIRLTSSGTDTHPTWAPDGHHLAFARGGNGLPPDIFVIGDDGSGLARLTHGGGWQPTWSPDGTELAYRNGVSDGGHIFIVRADGTHARQLTSGLEEGSPAWSPDGTRIAFDSTHDASIYTIRTDGTNVTRVTTCTRPVCGNDGAPAWSPDASEIVFERSLGSRRQIDLVNATGGRVHPLVTDTDDDCCAAWA